MARGDRTRPARAWPDLDPLLALAERLAATWATTASTATTPARERAMLRLFGVEGLDRSGEPLAAAVLARALARDPDRLSYGIALPFAVALLEYDATPQDLALDIAAGSIDLDLEAELLRDPERRAGAELLAHRLGAAALARIDANRLARHDLRDVIGDPDAPLVSLDLDQPVLDQARSEAVRRVAAGADVLRVKVPAVRELIDRLLDAGIEPPDWRPRDDVAVVPDPIPAGAQRALAVLRRVVDEAAAERGGYVRLMTVTSPLAAPEQAAVAAFERVDLVEADPIGEIVEGGVDPERVLADHAFAHRLHRRAGTHLLIDAGPLVVGPDLARGVPSDAATRNGRAFAMQLLGIALARRDGLPAQTIIAGVLPRWLVDEPNAALQAIAQAALRRAALPDLGLAIVEPDLDAPAVLRWTAILAAGLLGTGPAGAAMVIRRGSVRETAGLVAATRLAADSEAQILSGTAADELRGPALDHIAATVLAARTTLELLDGEGWPGLLEVAGGAAPLRYSSRESVVGRRETFDPLDAD